LNRAPLPSGQYLLNALPKNTMPLRYPATAPSEKKIQLHGLALQIRPVVLSEGRYLRGKADTVFANPPPQFAEGKFLNLFGDLGARAQAIIRIRNSADRHRDRLV
jgi:hypothetical protein